jgi:hypothetical protein
MAVVVLTVILRAVRTPSGSDATASDDYYTEAPSPDVVKAAEREVTGAESSG